jgi:hypothetical protein
MRVARVYERWLPLYDARSAREGQRGRPLFVAVAPHTGETCECSDSEARISDGAVTSVSLPRVWVGYGIVRWPRYEVRIHASNVGS